MLDFIPFSYKAKAHQWAIDYLDPKKYLPPFFKSNVLVSSIPKSGSHLLLQIFRNLPEAKRAEIMLPSHRPISDFPPLLKRLHRDRICWGHIGCEDQTLDLVDKYGLKVVVILRDPRDVVVSMTDHITKLKPNLLRPYLSSISTREEQIRAMIQGCGPDAADMSEEVRQSGMLRHSVGYYDIGSVCRMYLPWYKRSEAVVVKYEHLMASGNDEHLLERAAERIARHLELSSSVDELVEVVKASRGQKTATYFKGMSGRWREEFTDSLEQTLKDVAGEELIELGYESTQDW